MTTDTDTSASAPTRHASFSVHHQSVFVTAKSEAQNDSENTETKTVDEAGLLALDDEPFETTLFDHGVNVDTRQRTTRIDTGDSDEFIDDRPLSAIRSHTHRLSSTHPAPGLQETLFAKTTDDQQTLGGRQASARFMFEAQQRRRARDIHDGHHQDRPQTKSRHGN